MQAARCRCSLPARVSTHRCVKDSSYLFITVSYGRGCMRAHTSARPPRHSSHVVEDSRSKQSQIYAPRREWEAVRLWHYFGAGTCSDVGGNQVIACIDRVEGRGVARAVAAATVGARGRGVAAAEEGYPTCRIRRSSSKCRMLFRNQWRDIKRHVGSL